VTPVIFSQVGVILHAIIVLDLVQPTVLLACHIRLVTMQVIVYVMNIGSVTTVASGRGHVIPNVAHVMDQPPVTVISV